MKHVRDPKGGAGTGDDGCLGKAEREFLCLQLDIAILDIRVSAREKNVSRILAIAEAFHNVPDLLFRKGFSWDRFLTDLEGLKDSTGDGSYLDRVRDFLKESKP